MKKMICVISVLWLLIPVLALAGDDAPPMGPPKILQIVREEVKPGKGPAHSRVASAWPPALAKAKWPVHYLGMNSITGPSEALFLVGRDSFADLEKDYQELEKAPALQAELNRLGQQDSELVAGARNVIAAYREDLSYRAASANIAKMRYFQIATYRIRPGHDMEFAEAAKIVRGAYEKLNVDVAWAIFQATSGAPGGTFYVFVPLKSLADVDAGRARSKALQEAEGEEGVKRLQQIQREAYIGSESAIYAFNPKMSYASKEFAAADPDFWTPKAAKAAGGAKMPASERKIPEKPAKK